MKFFLTKLLFQLLLIALSYNLHAQPFTVDTIQYNGDGNKYINIVFMGDGFQSNELDTFKTSVQSLADYLFSTSPFTEYKNYFNVFAIRVPSGQSGANHPGTASDESTSGGQPVLTVNIYFNSTFDFASIHRLLVPQNYTALFSILMDNFPLADQPLVIVNTPYYGGSGGSVATSSLHTSAYEILVHELGHSFAGLGDEYYAGDAYFAEKPNMTQESNPLLVRWKNWIGQDGVGIYPYCCGGNAALWYKPHQNCKMQFLGSPFCPVCKETIVESIHGLIGSPIIDVTPVNNAPIIYCTPISFKVNLVNPSPATIRVKWILNGNQLATNNDSVEVTNGLLLAGKNILVAEVLDTTALSRSDQHPALHTYRTNWTIYNSDPYTPILSVANDTAFCAGDSLAIVASFANSYLWNTGATSQSIMATSPGNYFVTTTDVGGCSGTSAAIQLAVSPKPTLGADTSIAVICNNETVDITGLYNTAGLTINWGEEATPHNAPIGTHRLIATNAFGCADTAVVTIKQLVSNWTGAISSNWHVPSNWSANNVPDSKTHVVIRGNSNNPCIIGQQDAEAASLQLIQGGTYQLINNRKLLLSGHCSSLPVE